MTADPYSGRDLLADVFEGTQDAPLPVPSRDAGGHTLSLWANPEDPRWSVSMSRHPNGDVWVVYSCQPRETA